MEDLLTEFEEKEVETNFFDEINIIVLFLILLPFYIIYKSITKIIFMKFDWSVEKKNPMFYFVVSFFLGLVIGFIGWQMNESTKISTANVGVWVKWIGIIMAAGGLGGMLFYKKGKKKL